MEMLFKLQYTEYDMPIAHHSKQVKRTFEGLAKLAKSNTLMGYIEVTQEENSNYPAVWLVNGYFDETLGELEFIKVPCDEKWSATLSVFADAEEDTKLSGEWFNLKRVLEDGSNSMRQAKIELTPIESADKLEAKKELWAELEQDREELTCDCHGIVWEIIWDRVSRTLERVEHDELYNFSKPVIEKARLEIPGTAMRRIFDTTWNERTQVSI